MMKTKIVYLFECIFMDDHTTRLLRVVAPSFCQAASVACSVSSQWEDSDRYELSVITKKYVVSSIA